MEFRYAEEKDTGLILQFIRELADYEKMLSEVVATEALLKEWIFEKQKAEVIFAVEDGCSVDASLCNRISVIVENLSGLVMERHRRLWYQMDALRKSWGMRFTCESAFYFGQEWTFLPLLVCPEIK